MFPAYKYREGSRGTTEQAYNSRTTPGILRSAPFNSKQELDGSGDEERESEEVKLSERGNEGGFVSTGVFGGAIWDSMRRRRIATAAPMGRLM